MRRPIGPPRGSPMIFVERPISAILRVAVIAAILLPAIGAMRRCRQAT
ncbi:MAG TPA: hypothetical protein PKC84_06035 [Paracoccaceae bacterium]|nr:hypothetical protein [Paracoccaceae bacterium]